MKQFVYFLLLIFLISSCKETSVETDNNRNPEIVNITANPDTIVGGEKATLTCIASDPDGDDLTYVWEALIGSINGVGNQVTWLAPDSAGTVYIVCKVLDGNGGEAKDSVKINFTEAEKNHNPEIMSLMANPDTIFTGDKTTLTCIATDQDGDDLTYVWEALIGSINGVGNQVTWLAPDSTGTVYVVCKVLDGNGGEAKDSVKIDIELKIPTEGLVAYYPFNNGSADDESDNSNHGIVVGPSSTSDRFGRENSAIYFDGIDDYIWIDEDPSLEPDNFTISFWFKTEKLSTNEYQSLVFKEDGYNEGYKVIFRSELKDEKAQSILFMSSSLDNSTPIYLYSNEKIEYANTWYHIVACFEAGGKMRLFINNRFDSEISGPTNWDKYNSGELVLGRFTDEGTAPYGGYFHGSLDDLRIYNRVLSLEEINALYNEK
ncbi:MAG TPA: LamG domain-containing protein [Caldithrix abyssi]|uniref:LamG domain-containing protein n=1 Tax=Caldithrix abyssi TaxID=187145 RepID=A0A7V4WX56_CALAY|nr:LamG domain-containing protein [Caldithrix abyssi]